VSSAGLSYLVDTSVIARLTRPAVASGVRRLLPLIGRTTLADLEVGFSARNGGEWERLVGPLDSFRAIDIEPHHLRRAANVQRSLAAAGLRGRSVPDLIIAACAEDHRLTVLHYDADFDHIASVTGQRTEWVVPAGSLD
jgi:predicted nucleic acid-binding protein